MEEFEWEFHEGPAGPSVYIIALDGEKIVGTNCVILITMIHVDGREILSGKSEDTLVDPEYRGKRIFAKIYKKLIEECKSEGVEVIWGFTPVARAFEKIGFEVPFSNLQSLVVLNVGGAYHYLSGLNPKNSNTDRLKILGLAIMSRGKSMFTSNPRSKSLQLLERNEPANLKELIGEEVKKIDGGLAIEQGAEYQKWRYSDNPHLHNPQFLEFSNNGSPIGYAVINVTDEKVCYISEIKFYWDVEDSLRRSAIQLLVDFIKGKGACLVRNWHFANNQVGQRDIRVTKESGFTLLDRGSHFVWMNLTENSLSPNNLILTIAATQGLK
jgi:GNAT superfamily N-acetyltransferase